MANYQAILQELYPENSYGGECGVFVHKLITIPLVGDTLSSKTAAVKKYGYTAQMVDGGYDAGDSIVFNVGTAAGHIGFCNNIVNGVMTITESNWNLDMKVHHTRQVPVHDPSIVGCLRGKLLFPIPPQTFNQKVLVLCSNIEPANMPQLQAGIAQYMADLAAQTTDFTVSVDYAPTEANFTVVTQTSNNTIYINPQDVVVAGQAVQQATGKQYDVVCLVYDDSKMSPMPNHPIEAPIYDGFNIIEIPLDWISSLGDSTIPLEIYPQSVEIFFAHELSHADYFLINTRGNFQLFDHTHDAMLSGFPSPVDYYLQYFMNLKPFWSYLIH